MKFLDLGTIPARSQAGSQAPLVNKYSKNSHYSQRFKSGQVGYQIVPLVLLIIMIYLFMDIR